MFSFCYGPLQIQSLETNLYSTHSEFEKLKDELKEATEQLAHSANEKTSLESQVEEGRRKCEQWSAQRKTLQVWFMFPNHSFLETIYYLLVESHF